MSAENFDWSTPTTAPSEEIGGSCNLNLPQQQQVQQQQPLNVASMAPQQQPNNNNNNNGMFGMVDQYGQNQLHQLQQQQMMAHRNQNNRTPDDDMSIGTANSSNKATVAGLPVQRQTPTLALPSTVMPPTVLTSVLARDGHNSNISKKPPAIRRRQGAKSSRLESPQDVLERMLSLRGYALPGNTISLRIKAEEANYDITPSPLQLASFGTEVVRAVHHSEVEKLGQLLSTGLSPNPCNQFRDSIVDLVCKRGNAPVFRCLLEHGCDLRICDGFGRTPLHHCCWAAEFCSEIATMILQVDPQQILMEDKRGQTPLEYVRAEQAAEWIEFLEDKANRFFPTGGTLAPTISLRNTRDANGHIPDPPRALPPELARAISSGQLSPQDLAQMDPTVRARFQ